MELNNTKVLKKRQHFDSPNLPKRLFKSEHLDVYKWLKDNLIFKKLAFNANNASLNCM